MDTKLNPQEAACIGGCDGIDEQLPSSSPATEVGHHPHAQLAHMALVPTASTNDVAPANDLSLIPYRHELRVLGLDVLPHEGRDSVDGRGRIAAKETRLSRHGVERCMEANDIGLRYLSNQHLRPPNRRHATMADC
jgi:hypothetical protein